MEVDHVPYIFGSFSRRRHSREAGQRNKRISIDSAPESRKKDSIDLVQRTRSFSKPFLELFAPKSAVIAEEDTRRRSAIRLALEDESPIFGQFPTFPSSIRKDPSFRARTNGITFEEEVQYIPPKVEESLGEFCCGWCRKTFTEPRVLSCLHSFCTKCLVDVENEEEGSVFEGKLRFSKFFCRKNIPFDRGPQITASAALFHQN